MRESPFAQLNVVVGDHGWRLSRRLVPFQLFVAPRTLIRGVGWARFAVGVGTALASFPYPQRPMEK
jgi:hypothetical protein